MQPDDENNLNLELSEETGILDYSEDQYTPEIIEEMKALGIPKPENVSWGSWIGPKDHSHRHDLIVHLAASGLPNKTIAAEIGMTDAWISVILSQPQMKAKIRAKQDELFGKDTRARLLALSQKALQGVEEVLDDKSAKNSDKLAASTYILDQAVGKAKQDVSIQGNLLGDLISRLDNLDSRPVLPQAEQLDTPPDSMQDFIDEFVPDNVKVGVRSEEP